MSTLLPSLPPSPPSSSYVSVQGLLTHPSLPPSPLFLGVPEEYEELGLAHVHFIGLDKDISNQTYEASIPINKAVDRRGDVLLAFEMNGEPIPRYVPFFPPSLPPSLYS